MQTYMLTHKTDTQLNHTDLDKLPVSINSRYTVARGTHTHTHPHTHTHTNTHTHTHTHTPPPTPPHTPPHTHTHTHPHTHTSPRLIPQQSASTSCLAPGVNSSLSGLVVGSHLVCRLLLENIISRRHV